MAQSNQGDLFFPDVTLGPGDNPAAKALTADELRGARKVLSAAALTYVAAAAMAILQLVRMLILANNRR